MSAMGEMPMPGGWSMSMVWARASDGTWSGAGASFLGMWIVMMVAMMLPSLIPMLRRYRQSVAGTGAPLGPLTAIVGLGYFLVWLVFGLIVFPLGATLAAIVMHQPALARAAPIAAGVVILIAGCIQVTEWKAHQLACWRTTSASSRAGVVAALRHGIHLGLHCARCCGNLMLILLVCGVMDFGVMAVVTAAITLERLAPRRWQSARRSWQAREPVPRAIGALAIGAGLFLIARAGQAAFGLS
jgi:predicted metal-binding membrane protein